MVVDVLRMAASLAARGSSASTSAASGVRVRWKPGGNAARFRDPSPSPIGRIADPPKSRALGGVLPRRYCCTMADDDDESMLIRRERLGSTASFVAGLTVPGLRANAHGRRRSFNLRRT